MGWITLVAVSVWLAMIFGWAMNIVKLIALLDGGVTGWMIGRIVGVFAAPLGAILGYF